MCSFPGKLIGIGGQFVKQLKTVTKCNIRIDQPNQYRNGQRGNFQQHNSRDKPGDVDEDLPQAVLIEGTRSQIDKCLDLVRDRFCMHPEVTLEQTNLSSVVAAIDPNAGHATPQDVLASGAVHSVFVSAITSGGEFLVRFLDIYTGVTLRSKSPLFSSRRGGGLLYFRKYQWSYLINAVNFIPGIYWA
jgi:hypothetical protein